MLSTMYFKLLGSTPQKKNLIFGFNLQKISVYSYILLFDITADSSQKDSIVTVFVPVLREIQ